MTDFNGFDGFDPYPRRPVPDKPTFTPPKFHSEEIVVGENLENYTRRVPSEDGTYVKVTTHSERIEKVKQPPTPEELAAQKKAERIGMGIAITLGSAFMALVGYAIYKDEKEYKRPLHAVPDEKGQNS